MPFDCGLSSGVVHPSRCSFTVAGSLQPVCQIRMFRRVHEQIHSYDIPELAQDGLAAARRYAAIAPAVPHAQHMPSHIFTRLGLWQESIESNLVGHAAAKAYAEKTFGAGGYDQETVHTLDYLAYAYLQTAQDRAAKGVVDEIASLKVGPTPNLPIAYAIAAIPARYALERRDWAAAAALTRTAANFPWERFPWAAAMTSFARALGAAYGGDLATARAEIARAPLTRDQVALMQSDNVASPHLPGLAELGIQPTPIDAVLQQFRGQD